MRDWNFARGQRLNRIRQTAADARLLLRPTFDDLEPLRSQEFVQVQDELQRRDVNARIGHAELAFPLRRNSSSQVFGASSAFTSLMIVIDAVGQHPPRRSCFLSGIEETVWGNLSPPADRRRQEDFSRPASAMTTSLPSVTSKAGFPARASASTRLIDLGGVAAPVSQLDAILLLERVADRLGRIDR